MKRKSKTKSVIVVKPGRRGAKDLVSKLLEGKPLTEAEFKARLVSIVSGHVEAAKAEAVKIGRPTRGAVPSVPTSVKGTPDEIKAWKRAAESAGLTFNAWARELMNAKAGVA